jgi:hypothetical protein
MAATTDCTTDPLKLVREGTSQEQRFSWALDPSSAPVNERQPAHGMVFAQAYAEYLQYYDASNVAVDNWQAFFSQDVSVQLAVTAIQDIEYYKSVTKSYFDYLNNLENKNKDAELKQSLGYLFSCVGTLAQQFDKLKEEFSVEVALKEKLQNLIKTQLAPALQRLLAIYKADLNILIPPAVHPVIASQHPNLILLGRKTINFADVYTQGLSKDWITDNSANWNAYRSAITADESVYGSGTTVFERVNHLATHNLFTTHFDQFLKVYARVVSEAKEGLEKTLTKWDRHEPHYALFLAFLRLLEYARAEANTLTARHLDFYYRDILRLKEKPAAPGKAHLLVELAKHVTQHELQSGELFKAGKDDLGKDAYFANDRTFVANQAKVAALKTVYRHDTEKVANPDLPASEDTGRIYAAPIANSDDGLGAKLTSTDESWHPFFNKVYENGKLTEIRMPKAEIGFAIASHYLWMAEGTRKVTVSLRVSGMSAIDTSDLLDELTCSFTSPEGWILGNIQNITQTLPDKLELELKLEGSAPAVTSYNAKVHGYNFGTDLPILLIKLEGSALEYRYRLLQNTQVSQLDLTVDVKGLRTLAVSNDFGPVDTSKPFQPFGASPVQGSALTIGSKEVFQKKLTSVIISMIWQISPDPFDEMPSVNFDFLKAGKWRDSAISAKSMVTSLNIIPFYYLFLFPFINVEIPIVPIPDSSTYELQDNLDFPVMDKPDSEPNEFFTTSSQHGFIRLKLTKDFGQIKYQEQLLKYLRKEKDADQKEIPNPGAPPVGPIASELSLSYVASQTILLGKNDSFAQRKARFYHLGPFGQAEQHGQLITENAVPLLPQFQTTAGPSEAELYIGISNLHPPQNLALLFQIADGTADPQSDKPEPHIHWSYLRRNEWISFKENEVEDHTDELLNSGVVTFAVPRDAAADNTLLPSGMHWIRAAVAVESDAVCRLRMVAAQALDATFTNRGNDPTFPAKVLPAGTISKLEQPAAAVKKITQPFATFGGRGAELPSAFYTRISERLRHKDRAIALWDYEHLILEAFPQIYKVKCLNHTLYKKDEYKELAAGHVTIVTIPNQQFHNLRDPLRPYTSLALLGEIEAYAKTRRPCFAELHVCNPIFEEVWTEFKVCFYAGFDQTFYAKKLQEEITRFLSPWAFPGGGSPTFGGKVYKSVLLNFIEERPFVDYVTDFKLFHQYETKDSAGAKIEVTSPDLTEVEGSKAVSILVSVPAEGHKITVIDPKASAQLGEKCCDV